MKPTFLTLAVMAALGLVFAAAGCANRYEQNHLASGRGDTEHLTVAVMPFQGVSESPGSGLIVADVMANELYAIGGYTVVTPEVVAARAAPREGETLSPADTGKLIGAPFILTGRVTEYTYKSGVGEQPAVGVTARLIESGTGRVLWSGTRARTGSAAWFQEDSLGLLTSRICRSLVESMNGQARTYGYGTTEDEYSTFAYPAAEGAEKKTPPSTSTLPPLSAPTAPSTPPPTVSVPALPSPSVTLTQPDIEIIIPQP